MRSNYVMGLDLGPPGQPTGFAVLEQLEDEGPARDQVCHVRHLERFPPATSYPSIIEAVVKRATSPALRGSLLVVDWTAVGKDLIDRLRKARLPVVPVTISAGQVVQQAEGGGWMVPKKELVTSLQFALQSRRLKVAPDLQQADMLVTELGGFRLRRVTIGDTEGAEWRTGPHDDLVFAVALACWHAGHFRPLRAGSIHMGPLLINSPTFGRLNV